MSTLHFTKMHGLGNDFIIINALNQTYSLTPDIISRLANRFIGIGCDQILLIESSHLADFFCRIYNSDGSEAEQCGNGLRCIARYIHEEGIFAKSNFQIETKAGIFLLEIMDYDHIRVAMGIPKIQNALTDLKLSANSPPLSISILSTGNPHAIIRVDSLESTSLNQLIPQISSHSLFPNGINIGLIQIVANDHIKLRTFERGAGETHACGSNACAAAVASMVNHWVGNKVKVEFKYGSLIIEWDKGNNPIYMTGSASRVFSGVMKHYKNINTI